MQKIYKPTDNYPSFYQPYMGLVPDNGNLIQHLNDIQIETEKLIDTLSEEKLTYSYSKNKWTIKDILVHLADCERIFIYRAMRIARGDKTDLPAFDENVFALNANANNRKIGDIIKELSVLRVATLVFIETLDEESLDRTGTANGYPMSTRLLVNHIYGHQRHHLNIIRERYL
ncbi:MAG: DinB family protein [Bacteroidota bacterium]|nr:DinB family protein [Bacteroidota bacterium]